MLQVLIIDENIANNTEMKQDPFMTLALETAGPVSNARIIVISHPIRYWY